jgi:hypothetical protein
MLRLDRTADRPSRCGKDDRPGQNRRRAHHPIGQEDNVVGGHRISYGLIALNLAARPDLRRRDPEGLMGEIRGVLQAPGPAPYLTPALEIAIG